jgi:hypothetical protein
MTTVVQVPTITKLSATPYTDHIVCSPNETHSCLLKDSNKLDLPVDGREKEIKVKDISPLPKPRRKPAMKTGCRGDRSEEITGCPFKAALEIKDALKNKVNAHAKKNLAWDSHREQNSVEKSKKIQARMIITKHSVFTAMKNMVLNKRTGLCAKGASCGYTDMYK